MEVKKIAIIGAGNGGFAISANLALAGHCVNLYELPRFEKNVTEVRRIGGIEITGASRTGFTKLNRITTDIKEAIKDTSYIFVVTQAVAHEEIARLVAPYIKSEQTIFILPGSGGSLIFSKVFHEENLRINVDIAEALSLPYACRKTGAASVNVIRMLGAKSGKNGIGALPSKHTAKVVSAFNEIYPNTFPMTNVLETALCNSNFLKHPAVTLLNVGRIEYSKGEFWFYKEGITPSVARVIEALDSETKPIFRKLGFNIISPKQADVVRYEKNWDERHAAIRELGHKGPRDTKTRFITEDVPIGLVMIASFGKWLGIPTPTYDSIINLSSVINGVDYWKEPQSRTVEKLGLGKMSLEEIQRFLREGSK